MKTVAIRDLAGGQVGEEMFDDALISGPVRQDILHAAVTAFLANQRQGTAAAKTRAEVSGSGRKPWRQKGTGRVGETRNPVWRHGGVVFAPKPRDYRVPLARRVRRAAVREAIRDRILRDRFTVLAAGQVDKPRTRLFAGFLKAAGISGTALFVLPRSEGTATIRRSIQNIRMADYIFADQLHAYAVLRHDNLIVIQQAMDDIRKLLTPSAPPADDAGRQVP